MSRIDPATESETRAAPARLAAGRSRSRTAPWGPRTEGAPHEVDTDLPAAVVEADVAGNGLTLRRAGLPELLSQLTIEVPAGFRYLEPEGAIGTVGMFREGVGAEHKAGPVGIAHFQPAQEGGEHAAADAATLVFGRDMHRPEIDAGLIPEVDGDAANGRVSLAGYEVAVRARALRPGQHVAGPGGFAKVAEVEGMEGEPVFVPRGELGDEVCRPRPEHKAGALDLVRIDRSYCHGNPGRSHFCDLSIRVRVGP